MHWLGELFASLTWLMAVAWCGLLIGAYRHRHAVPNIAGPEWDVQPEGMPSLTVVVPARDEEQNIAATLQSLLAADYPKLQIVAVDDRSRDATGKIIDSFAEQAPEKLRAMHVTELPEGWLGKTWAMESAAHASQGEWLLFTDADVVFEPTVLRRALVYAEREQAAHVVVAPTPLVKSFGEGVLLGFFQVFGTWTARPWRVHDPKVKSAAVGVGAFNMVRRSAFDNIYGLQAQRMTVVEDFALGRRIKSSGQAQRIASAPNMVRVHWAAGVGGLVRVLTKNLFSSLNFNPALLLFAVTWVLLFGLLPVAGLFLRATWVPAVAMLIFIGIAYNRLARNTGIPARYGWMFPVGALVFAWALLRSSLAAWVRGGVVWRGTHYPLRELRQHNSPFLWRAKRPGGAGDDVHPR